MPNVVSRSTPIRKQLNYKGQRSSKFIRQTNIRISQILFFEPNPISLNGYKILFVL